MRWPVLAPVVISFFLVAGCNSGGADRAELEQRTTGMASDLVAELVSAAGFMLDDMGAGGAATWLENWLNAVVFEESQVESEEPGKVVYHLHGETVCTGKILGLIMGGCHGNPDCLENRADFQRKCAKKVNQIGVRLELTDAGDGVALALQVGDLRHPLAGLSLNTDSLSLLVDLDQMNPGLTTILAAFHFDPPIRPDELTGSVLIDIQLTGEGMIGTLSIPQDGAIVVGPLDFQLTAAPDLVVVEIAEALASLEAAVELPAFTVSWDGKIPYLDYVAKIGLDIVGLSGSATYSGSIDTLVVNHFAGGPGQSRLLLNDQMLIGLDINAPGGGAVAAQLTPGLTHPVISLYPGVLIDLDFDAGPIDEMLGFELGFLPDALRAKSYTIALEDENSHFRLVPTFVNGHWDALEILSGLARLSDSDGAEVLVEEGSCVGVSLGCFLQAANFVDCFSSQACPLSGM